MACRMQLYFKEDVQKVLREDSVRMGLSMSSYLQMLVMKERAQNEAMPGLYDQVKKQIKETLEGK